MNTPTPDTPADTLHLGTHLRLDLRGSALEDLWGVRHKRGLINLEGLA